LPIAPSPLTAARPEELSAVRPSNSGSGVVSKMTPDRGAASAGISSARPVGGAGTVSSVRSAAKLASNGLPAEQLSPAAERSWFRRNGPALTTAALRAVARVEVEGLENIPLDGPIVLAAN